MATTKEKATATTDTKKKGITKCPDEFEAAMVWYDERIANAQAKVDKSQASLNRWIKSKQAYEAKKNVDANKEKAKAVLMEQGFNEVQIKAILKD